MLHTQHTPHFYLFNRCFGHVSRFCQWLFNKCNVHGQAKGVIFIICTTIHRELNSKLNKSIFVDKYFWCMNKKKLFDLELDIEFFFLFVMKNPLCLYIQPKCSQCNNSISDEMNKRQQSEKRMREEKNANPC